MRQIRLVEKPITFTSDIPSLRLSGKGLGVYHKSFADRLPSGDGIEWVEFGRMSKEFRQRDPLSFGGECLVFVGLNRIFTPSSRIHPVFERLQTAPLPDGICAYSIDHAPYIGELWRLFAHWSFTRLDFGGYTYSFLLESHYKAFCDGAKPDNPLTVKKIAAYAKDKVDMDYEVYFKKQPMVEIIKMDQSVHRKYQDLKARLFDAHETIAPIIRGLSAFAQEACPARRIMRECDLFERPDNLRIVRTDLKVDEHLAGQLLAKVKEVNAVCRAINS